MPEMAASKSSLKVSPPVVKALPALSIVKRIDVVLELLSDAAVNTLVKVGATADRVSWALAAATGTKPVPVSVLVVLV